MNLDQTLHSINRSLRLGDPLWTGGFGEMRARTMWDGRQEEWTVTTDSIVLAVGPVRLQFCIQDRQSPGHVAYRLRRAASAMLQDLD